VFCRVLASPGRSTRADADAQWPRHEHRCRHRQRTMMELARHQRPEFRTIHSSNYGQGSLSLVCFSHPRVATLGVHIAPNSSNHRTHVWPWLAGNFFFFLDLFPHLGCLWKLPATDDPTNRIRLRSTFTLARLSSASNSAKLPYHSASLLFGVSDAYCGLASYSLVQRGTGSGSPDSLGIPTNTWTTSTVQRLSRVKISRKVSCPNSLR
jgi:hypothetical protein